MVELGNAAMDKEEMRQLAESERGAGTVASLIISGIFFAAFASKLLQNNSLTLGDIKNLPLDNRLNACIKMCTIVCVFSGFLNIFQLTEIDDALLPRSNAYTLDMARPLEWMMTCPVMQAVLVVLAGPFVPHYRLAVMPALSLIVLLIGAATLAIEETFMRLTFYGVGCLVAFFMFYINRKQILEVTNNEEGLFYGEGFFRKLSAFLVVTWFPFPLWFMLSPEGWGFIDDFDTVQVGWAVLNITAKCGFAAILQVYKWDYFKKMERGFGHVEDEEAPNNAEFMNIDTILDDVLDYLGLSERDKELKHSFARAKVKNCLDLHGLNEVTCKEVGLPWGVVYCAKRRLHTMRFSEDEAGNPKIGNYSSDGEQFLTRMFREGLGCNVGAVKKVMEEAEEQNMDLAYLSMCRTRLEEVRNWRSIYSYMSTSRSFKEALVGTEHDEVALAVDAGVAMGIDVSRAKERLHNLSEKKTACKNAVRQGIACFKDSNFQEALNAFTEALGHDPEAVDALLNRAATLARLGSWEASEEDAAKCLELDPKNEKAFHKQAVALFNQGKLQVACTIISQGLSKNPGSQALASLQSKACMYVGGMATQTEEEEDTNDNEEEDEEEDEEDEEEGEYDEEQPETPQGVFIDMSSATAIAL